jgi:hypothetical protein
MSEQSPVPLKPVSVIQDSPADATAPVRGNPPEAPSYIQDLASKWAGQSHEPYTEVAYTSKGEFQVGFYQTGTKARAWCKGGTIASATAFLEVADIAQLKALVDQARTTLQAK